MGEIKTAFEAQQDIFNRLVSEGVKASCGLTGNIYLLSKPKDSKKEDIVIGVLTMSADQVQEGVFNVNIHVPNLQLKDDNTQPNINRFKEILLYVTPLLLNYSGFNYRYDAQTTGIPFRDGEGWFVNIRVGYWSLRRS